MNITIVGGGTAGWFTAFYISQMRKNVNVTIVDSSKIPSVGVGEGTTARIIEVLLRPQLGVNLTEFFKKTFAIPKLAIKFENWSDNEDFYSPIGPSLTSENYIDYAPYLCYLKGINIERCYKSSLFAKRERTNAFFNDGSIYFSDFSPALHVDAGALVSYFKERCSENNVTHVDAEVVSVNKNENCITSINLKSGKKIKSDFYIDCSGFSKVLISEMDGYEWVDYSKHLPVDRGMPFTIEETRKTKEKHPYTKAIAMKNGWVWEISTQNKIGRGYVFSSKFATEEECVDELEQHYRTSVQRIKTIKFSSGRVKKFISGNCLSLGLSSAFLEPLQATSLHCTVFQLDEFIYTFLRDKKVHLDIDSVDWYNSKYAKMYDDMRDFIFCHYTGGKSSTKFWNYFNQIDYPDEVKKKIHYHNSRLLRDYDSDRYHGYVHPAMWIPTLLGLGHSNKETIEEVISSDMNMLDLKEFVYYNERKLLDTIKERNLTTVKTICKNFSN